MPRGEPAKDSLICSSTPPSRIAMPFALPHVNFKHHLWSEPHPGMVCPNPHATHLPPTHSPTHHDHDHHDHPRRSTDQVSLPCSLGSSLNHHHHPCGPIPTPHATLPPTNPPTHHDHHYYHPWDMRPTPRLCHANPVPRVPDPDSTDHSGTPC